MFSKLIALGLCALTLSAAAPSQQLMVSQELTVSCAISQVALGSGTIEPGIYQIYSMVAPKSPLMVLRPFTSVLISKETPSNEQWVVTPTGENSYRIINAHYSANNFGVHPVEGVLYMDLTPAEFSIYPAGDNTYVIKAPSADSLWTVSNPNPNVFSSTVELKGADGSDAQRWIFTRVDDE
ncbi:hypothetical protein B0H19DRAFT_1261269 [Mycena capillaripes]|nr:hypothetical protein B0H19DRAFT_1261269 [Mycena capillaripes]